MKARLMTAEPEAPVACIANIGRRGRRQRSLFGAVLLGVGVLVAALLVALHVPGPFRLGLALIFYVGGTGIFQAREKT